MLTQTNKRMDTQHIPMKTTAQKWTLYSDNSIASFPDKLCKTLHALLADNNISPSELDTGVTFLRKAKTRAYELCPLFLENTNKFPKGSFSKICFDLLMWSHTPSSMLFLRLCFCQDTYVRFISLDMDKKMAVINAVRRSVRWMQDRCSEYKLRRFDEAQYPTQGQWNNKDAQKQIEKWIETVSRFIIKKSLKRERDTYIHNQVYINVQPPLSFQTFERYPVKIGMSSMSGRMRIEQEAHAALFRPLCDVFVELGPDFKSNTQTKLGVVYDKLQNDNCLFEKFMHHKWNTFNNRHLVTHYQGYSHEEMFHMSIEVLRQLVRDLKDEQIKYDYILRCIEPHEHMWILDHVAWKGVFGR